MKLSRYNILRKYEDTTVFFNATTCALAVVDDNFLAVLDDIENNAYDESKYDEYKSYLVDEATKDKAGSLGKINYGDLNSNYDELIKAAISLKDGDYSKTVISTELGYHVILKVKSYEKESFDTLKDEILNELATQYKVKNQNTVGYDTITSYRKKYGMTIEDDELKSQYNTYITNLYAQITANSSK